MGPVLSSTLRQDWVPSHLEGHWDRMYLSKASSSTAQKTADLPRVTPDLHTMAPVDMHWSCKVRQKKMPPALGRAPPAQQPTHPAPYPNFRSTEHQQPSLHATYMCCTPDRGSPVLTKCSAWECRKVHGDKPLRPYLLGE